MTSANLTLSPTKGKAMDLFVNAVPRGKSLPVELLYSSEHRFGRRIDYSICETCPLRGNPKVWRWRGNCQSPLCFVGINPGTQEKEYGWPFVGPAGNEMDKTVIGPLGLGTGQTLIGNNLIFLSGQFYITNLVKCWTLHNDEPPVEAVKLCWQHLLPELEGRKLIVLLGQYVQENFADLYHGSVELMPMIHPAAATRKGLYKAILMRDAGRLRRKLEYATSEVDGNVRGAEDGRVRAQ